MPLRRCQSAMLTAAAHTRTSTSFSLAAGLSMSLSSRTSGEPYLCWTIALITTSRDSTRLPASGAGLIVIPSSSGVAGDYDGSSIFGNTSLRPCPAPLIETTAEDDVHASRLRGAGPSLRPAERAFAIQTLGRRPQ